MQEALVALVVHILLIIWIHTILNSSHDSIFVIYCFLTTLFIYTANIDSGPETTLTPETSFILECQSLSNTGALIGVTVVAVIIFLILLLIIVLLLLKLRLVICF